jgi:broad specificity phosphatase PhoE
LSARRPNKEVILPTTKIMVIRHAEKPSGEPGLMPDGTKNPEALTATGWRRANALVGLFVPPTGRFTDPHLATPQTIFASGIGHPSNSLRPQRTVTPLATKLNVPIKKHLKGDEAGLVHDVTVVDGVVLIAWEHEAIPDIANLLIRGSRHGLPSQWPGHRFDLVWVFTDASETWSFAQVPQLLLPGDSADPIPL